MSDEAVGLKDELIQQVLKFNVARLSRLMDKFLDGAVNKLCTIHGDAFLAQCCCVRNAWLPTGGVLVVRGGEVSE